MGRGFAVRKKKFLWLLGMAGFLVVLYTIVVSRVERMAEVITYEGPKPANSVSFSDINAMATPEPTEDIWPDIDITSAQYTIANDEHLLSPTYEPDTDYISITNSLRFDKAALPHLEDMIQGLKDAGFSVYIAGAYRTYSYQERLFNGKTYSLASAEGVYDYMDPRYQDYVEQARKIVAYPGSSEHQLGLAVDIMDKSYSSMIYENMNQDFYAWLDEHCAEYGFIKRYPTKKLLLTGWDEPWHYRYVGVEAATFIMETGMCYEEFYAHYVPDFTY